MPALVAVAFMIHEVTRIVDGAAVDDDEGRAAGGPGIVQKRPSPSAVHPCRLIRNSEPTIVNLSVSNG